MSTKNTDFYISYLNLNKASLFFWSHPSKLSQSWYQWPYGTFSGLMMPMMLFCSNIGFIFYISLSYNNSRYFWVAAKISIKLTSQFLLLQVASSNPEQILFILLSDLSIETHPFILIFCTSIHTLWNSSGWEYKNLIRKMCVKSQRFHHYRDIDTHCLDTF